MLGASTLALASLTGCLAPSQANEVVTVQAEKFGQFSWQVRARSLSELDSAINWLASTPENERPLLVRISLSPSAATEAREWMPDEHALDLANIDFHGQFEEALRQLGYDGYFYDHPFVGDVVGRRNAGVFTLGDETIYMGGVEAAEWATWVLWGEGIPASRWFSQSTYLDVPRRLHEEARRVLEEDPEWPKYSEQLTPVVE